MWVKHFLAQYSYCVPDSLIEASNIRSEVHTAHLSVLRWWYRFTILDRLRVRTLYHLGVSVEPPHLHRGQVLAWGNPWLLACAETAQNIQLRLSDSELSDTTLSSG